MLQNLNLKALLILKNNFVINLMHIKIHLDHLGRMVGDLVGGEHCGKRLFLANGQGFYRNPISHSYIPCLPAFYSLEEP